MKILSWNVQGAFPKFPPVQRIEDQIWYIDTVAKCPDIIALNEVSRFRKDTWIEKLTKIGYNEIVHTLDWAEELGESEVPPHQDISHVNGNLTAIHETSRGSNLTRLHPSILEEHWEGAELKDWDTNFPEKILHSTLDFDSSTVELWNIRTVPGSTYGEEKVKILNNTFARILKASQSPCVLTGDFNAPDCELSDGTIIPFRKEDDGEISEMWVNAELNILGGLEKEGMEDVFRSQHGYGNLDILEVSHATQTDDPLRVPPTEVEGKRFDHMIASTELNPQQCRYDQAGFHCSDHAPLIAKFRPQYNLYPASYLKDPPHGLSQISWNSPNQKIGCFIQLPVNKPVTQGVDRVLQKPLEEYDICSGMQDSVSQNYSQLIYYRATLRETVGTDMITEADARYRGDSQH